jgi:hypothetical protein
LIFLFLQNLQAEGATGKPMRVRTETVVLDVSENIQAEFLAIKLCSRLSGACY